MVSSAYSKSTRAVYMEGSDKFFRQDIFYPCYLTIYRGSIFHRSATRRENHWMFTDDTTSCLIQPLEELWMWRLTPTDRRILVFVEDATTRYNTYIRLAIRRVYKCDIRKFMFTGRF